MRNANGEARRFRTFGRIPDHDRPGLGSVAEMAFPSGRNGSTGSGHGGIVAGWSLLRLETDDAVLTLPSVVAVQLRWLVARSRASGPGGRKGTGPDQAGAAPPRPPRGDPRHDAPTATVGADSLDRCRAGSNSGSVSSGSVSCSTLRPVRLACRRAFPGPNGRRNRRVRVTDGRAGTPH